MGSGISCHQMAADAVSTPKAKLSELPESLPAAGAPDDLASEIASATPARDQTTPKPGTDTTRFDTPVSSLPLEMYLSASSKRSTSEKATGATSAGQQGNRVAASRPVSAAVATTTFIVDSSGADIVSPPVFPPTATAARSSRRLPHIGGLAVSMAFLLDFAERNVAPSQPTWSVVDQLIKLHTQKDTVRYVDLPHVFRHTLPPGRTDYYFVSHAWGRPFWEMVGLCAHYLRGAVAEDTFVWCDIFIINQHPGLQQADDLHQLRLAVQDAAATLVCTDAAGAPFERIWCLFEMWITLTVVTATDPADGSNEEAAAEAISPTRSRSQALVVLTTGLSAAQRAKLYGQIDASTAKATVIADKERILAIIAASTGGVTAFNAAMRSALLLRPLDYEGELAAGLVPEGTALQAPPPPPPAAGTSASSYVRQWTRSRNWDFAPLDTWLAILPGHKHHRALALLGGPGTGKSSAAAAAVARLMGPGALGRVRRTAESEAAAAAGGGGTAGGVPVAAHFCRASSLQALDPLAALRTLAYQLSLLFPERLQEYYAFGLAKNHGRDSGRAGSDGGDGDTSFALQAIAGMATAEGGGGGGRSGSGGDEDGGNRDAVAAAFEALLLRPLQLVWKSYEAAVQGLAASDETSGSEDHDKEIDDAKRTEAGPTVTLAVADAPPPPQLVILLDAIDEGDSGAVGGSHENAMLLLLQEHFPRLPPFVRLIVTARPLPHIRALLTHKFEPLVVSPDQLRPPAAAGSAALAARLARRPWLAAALQQPASAAAAWTGSTGIYGGIAGIADRLWQASKGWMLFLRLAEDVLESAAAHAAATTVTAPAMEKTPQLPMTTLQAGPLDRVLSELESTAVSAAAPALYSLYMRELVAPSIASAVVASAAVASKSSGCVDSSTAERPEEPPEAPTATDLAFLLEVLGAAREPLYLSQLKDLGLPTVSSGDGGSGGGAAAKLRLGSLVTVRGYKLHGIHRSLFEWLATGGAEEVPQLLATSTTSSAATGRATGDIIAAPSSMTSSGGRGLVRGHSALATMALRDVAGARASQSTATANGGGGGGGARGPRGPDSYSLQHATAHVLEAAAARTAAGDVDGSLELLRSLLLDFYYWRCVYQDGSSASVALAALLRHEGIFSSAAARIPGGGGGGGGGGAAAALASDAARWLQSYHASLLRFPEAVLQSALALPAASPIRIAALAALSPPRPVYPSSPSFSSSDSRTLAAISIPDGKPQSRPASSSGAPRPSTESVLTTNEAVTVKVGVAGEITPPAASAHLEGSLWPRAFPLRNPVEAWDACLLTTESRGVTRGLAWMSDSGLVATACDDRKVHLLSPVTGGQVGLMEGHTDRVYCLALRPEPTLSRPPTNKIQHSEGAAAAGAAVIVASGSLDGRVVLWDVGSRMQIQMLEPGAPAEGGGEDVSKAEITTYGYSVLEDRPTGPSTSGSVDCLIFSPDGAWLAAGNSDGSITMWRMLEEVASGGAATRSGDGVIRAIKMWVAPEAHQQAVAALTFLYLEGVDGAAAGTSLGVDGERRGELPRFLLASTSEDGNIHLWDPRVAESADGGSGVAIVSEPLRTLRADSDVQVQYEATGLEPQPRSTNAAADPWFVYDMPTCSGASTNSAGGDGEEGTSPATLQTQPPLSQPLLVGVAEDLEGQQSRASYRATEYHSLASGPGLPPGCLLAGSGSGPVVVWDVFSGLIRERLRGHVSGVHCLALQCGGPHFASGSGDSTIRLWRHLPTADSLGWAAALQSAAQKARDDTIAVDAARAAAAVAKDERRNAHQQAIKQSGADSEAGQNLEGNEHGDQDPVQEQDEEEEEEEEDTIEESRRVCRRPCQWQCVVVLRGHTRLVTSLTFLSTGGPQRPPATATAYRAGGRPGQEAATTPQLKQLENGLRKSASDAVPTVCRLASASVDFSVRIWRADLNPAVEASTGGGAVGTQQPVGHEGFSVNAVALSPDGRLIATGADDFQVCIWDCFKGTHLRTLRCFHGRVRAVAFSRDSKRMAAAAEDGAVFIFDINGDSFSTIGWCRGHTKAATGVAFSPDGYSVASSSEDGTARIWAVRGMQTALLEGHPSGATAVAWAEEGTIVATGAARGDPGVKLWDARMGMCINTFRYHTADVAILAFGSAIEHPTAPSRPSTAKAASGDPSAVAKEDAPPLLSPRRHVLLMSVDVRGLACVWDVWGGGLLHYINQVQGADLKGSQLLWLQARAMHYADVQELLQPPPPRSTADGKEGADGDGRQRQWRRRRLTTALAALYPPGEAVEVVAAGKGLSCVVAVTDKQRLYIFRPGPEE